VGWFGFDVEPGAAGTVSAGGFGRMAALRTTSACTGEQHRRTLSSPPDPAPPPSHVTQLLVAWRGGDPAALEELVPLVEAELRRLARGYLRRERPGHPLQTTALVNEAFVRLLNWRDVSWQNRAHFLAMAARLMRNILVDIARRRPKGADGADVFIVDLAAAAEAAREEPPDLVALDDALRELAALDPRKARIVELRFFGGLNLEEVAEVIGVAPVTVSREWAKARAWLHQQVTRRDPSSDQRG
jgi:RNA polymerase sigma factor (TIGR02999 family)